MYLMYNMYTKHSAIVMCVQAPLLVYRSQIIINIESIKYMFWRVTGNYIVLYIYAV
jgi:hypothetical protein